MKKLLSLALTIILAFSLVGCSNSKPETVVETFCTAMKTRDFVMMAQCMENGTYGSDDVTDESEDELDFASDKIAKYLLDCSSKMRYEIREVANEDDASYVTVYFTYVDASPVFTSAIGEYASQAIALAFSGADDMDIEDLFFTIFLEKIDSVSTGTANSNITFKCVKVNDSWKIATLSDDLQTSVDNILTSNMASSVNNIDEAANGNYGESYDDGSVDFENAVYYDIPLGQKVELATINLTINGCREVQKLTAEYMDDDIAQSGTKFVVLSVVIENTTKDTMDFNNDLVLTDSQGRNYEAYSDALWYFDETFCYTELAPNIPKSGVFVYNVPENSNDYYIQLGKSGTNDVYTLYCN